MKRTLAMAAAAAILFVACNKPDDPTPDNDTSLSPVGQKLIGTWERTHTATDINTNDTMDDSEKVPAASDEEYILVFNADGTGTARIKEIGVDTMLNTQWQLRDNDKNLVIKIDLISDTAINEIVDLTETSFITLNDVYISRTYKRWSVFRRK